MKFRPCIDIHNGKVKQIVGGSLKGDGSVAQENFVSGHDAAWFARFYLRDKLEGGHIIMLNPVSAPEYRATKEQALAAIQGRSRLLPRYRPLRGVSSLGEALPPTTRRNS